MGNPAALMPTSGTSAATEPANLNLHYPAAIADWCLDLAEERARCRDPHQQLLWCHVAATVLATQNRILAVARLERQLLQIAEQLDAPVPQRRPAASGKQSWLHVFNETFPHGGHTAMAERWALRDCADKTHSFALLAQTGAVPDKVRRAADATGGEVHVADVSASPLLRAAWLRTLAHETADYVVLHVHSNDVIAAVAFGVAGGPPVMLVNHTAHTFWVGTSTADLVLNCRGSALEGEWARQYRGVSDWAIVPIPLPDVEPRPDDLAARHATRDEFGIPRDAPLILTVGDTYKYQPTPDMDFLQECTRVLDQLPEAWIVAVGVTSDQRWAAATAKYQGRIQAVGRQSNVDRFHAAADVYIEGFPFGSTTALLESGMKGLPVVLSPAECPPPYGTDGIAIDPIVDRARNLAAYRELITHLCSDPAARATAGQRIAASIRQHHTGSGWLDHVRSSTCRLPAVHCLREPCDPPPTPVTVHSYWARFRYDPASYPDEILLGAIHHALRLGLKPKHMRPLIDALKDAQLQRIGSTVPLPVLQLICGLSRFVSPERTARIVRQATATCRRGSRTSRVLQAVWPAALW